MKVHTYKMSLVDIEFILVDICGCEQSVVQQSNLEPILLHGCETDPLMKQVLISNPRVATNMARRVEGYVLTKLLLLHLPYKDLHD